MEVKQESMSVNSIIIEILLKIVFIVAAVPELPSRVSSGSERYSSYIIFMSSKLFIKTLLHSKHIIFIIDL